MSPPVRLLGLPRELALALAALAIVLTITVIPAPFLIDDVNYVTNVVNLRQGRLTVGATEGLTPSSELVFFDPGPESRAVTSTPVASTAPPLYGPIALPFAFLGWRGLVALNTFALLFTIGLVFRYTERYAIDAMTPWFAAVAIGVGGYALEYSQGLWPHGLSVALCTVGILLVAELLNGATLAFAAAAGASLGLATGLRYQNAIIVAVACGAVVLWSPKRWRAAVAYTVAVAIPIAACAVLNHARLGSWNPISKGPGYLDVSVSAGGGSVLDPFLMFWARVVDMSVRPPLGGPGFSWVTYDPLSGGHLIFGVVLQKALLQSAPWAILAFLLFAAAWLPAASLSNERRRPLRLFSLIALALPAALALAGRGRHEGASFNQRYLLELLPLVAIAAAWALDGLRVKARELAAGGLLGALLFLLVFALPPSSSKFFATLKLPLFLAGVLAVVWFVRTRFEGWRIAIPIIAGACLGWGMTVHLLDDVSASRAVRRFRASRGAELRATLPDHSALIAYWGSRDAAGPLLLEKDLLVLDAHADDGKDARVLIGELLARNRRVFVLPDGMPDEVRSRVLDGWTTVVNPVQSRIVELRPPQ